MVEVEQVLSAYLPSQFCCDKLDNLIIYLNETKFRGEIPH